MKFTVIQKTTNFIAEVRTEMGKVTWPTREELKDSTIVVLVMMLILSVFIGIVDFFLSNLLTLVMR